MNKLRIIIILILSINITSFGQPVMLDVQGSIQLLNDADILGVDQLVGHNDLRLYGDNSGGPDIFISPSGNVGVGTTNPYVDFTIRQKTTPSFGFDGIVTSPSGLEIENINEFDELNGGLLFADHLSSLHFAFDEGASSIFTQKAHIRYDNGDYHSTSDQRFKSDISLMEPILNRFLILEPSTYNMIGEGDEQKDIGFIAQDVEKLFPEVVSSEEEYMSISYSKLSVLAIKAMQEQQEELRILILRLNKLDSDLTQSPTEKKSHNQ